MPKLIKTKKPELSPDARTQFQQWLRLHAGRIGSSEAAAACGFDKWTTPLGLYRRKIGETEYGEAGEAALWGQRLEEQVIDALFEEYDLGRAGMPKFCRESHCDWNGTFDFKQGPAQLLLASKKHPELIFSPDGFCEDKDGKVGIVEAKTVNAWSRDWGEEPPDRVRLQCWHGMYVTGLDYAIVPVLMGGQKFEAFTVERDDEVIADMVQVELEFLERVKSKTPPPADVANDLENLKDIYGEPNGETVDLPDQVEEVVANYLHVKEEIKRAEERKKHLGTELRALMGEYEFAKAGQFMLSLKKTERKAYVREVAASSYRTLRIKGHR